VVRLGLLDDPIYEPVVRAPFNPTVVRLGPP